MSLASCNVQKGAKSRGTVSKEKTSANVNSPSPIKVKYAKLLGVSPESIEDEAFYLYIDGWIGVPYKYGGTGKSGTDCSGFVSNVYRDVYNKSMPRTTSEMDESTKNVSKAELKEGDLVFFDINGKKSSHVGIYLLNNKFVHASTSKGVIISDLENPYYKSAFAKGGR